MTFEEVAREHANSRDSADTAALYNADLDAWLVFCEGSGVDPARPTLAAATKWRDALLERLAPATVRRTLAALSSMYDAAVARERLVDWNPFNPKVLKRPPPDEVGTTKEISRDEARRVFDAAEAAGKPYGWRDVAILRLLYDCGLRISSAVTIERQRVYRRDDGQLVIRGVKVKKRGRVEIEVPEVAADAIERWMMVAPAGKWLFPSSRGNRPLQRRAFNKRLELYGAQTGVTDVHPHRFRTAFISDALDKLPLNEVQAAVHHADPKTTQRYDRHKRGAGVTSAVARMRNS